MKRLEWRNGGLLQHENGHPHVDKIIQELGIDVLPHQLYTPDQESLNDCPIR